MRLDVLKHPPSLGLRDFHGLYTQAPEMEPLLHRLERVARIDCTVLVSGESGTGKELVARTIHERSALADGPFVAVNCAGLAETLLDSQLFGHRRGAFTGAVADHDGVFRAASGGTLFLDEVAEIPIGLQAKFLRAIQEREVVPLGSTRAIPVDVRLVAATNRDIEAEVDEARFRRDLFYRLNVVRIELPPLRARQDDVPVLVEHFVNRYSRQYGVAPKAVTPDALAVLQSYDWPGNVRELQNVVERTFALSDADTITLNDLPVQLRRPEGRGAIAVAPTSRHTLDETERVLIADTLNASGGNKNEAARRLGIDRQRLYRKLRKYGLA